MFRLNLALLALAAGAILGFLALPAFADARPGTPRPRADALEGRYIVTYKPAVDRPAQSTRERERRLGFDSRFVYSKAVKGFSAKLSPGQVKKLRRDPQVASVVADREVHALNTLSSGDSAPTGVRRIEAASDTQAHSRSGANVAVIDTGIDLGHSDLNATSGTDCVEPGTAAQDDQGHGTHVAGTVAARNNGSGVVGVAPGTNLVAVKVLDSAGSGTWSQIICGIDWVTGTRSDEDPSNDVAVANMSLGGAGDPVEPCSESMRDALHKAICGSTGAGVVYTVAAGNSTWDYDYEPIPDVPAAYPEVLTVTAASDTDGKPGALGGDCGKGSSAERDDRNGTFSNFAYLEASKSHTLAAPGACITSTRLGGGTTRMSGTSMAAPHVAGAVALCLDDDGTAGACSGLAADRPQDFLPKLTGTQASYGFIGDPNQPFSGGQFFGYLTRVGLAAETAEPDTTAPAAPSGLTATAGDGQVALDWADNSETDLAGYNVYRSTTAGGGYSRIAASVAGSSYTDSAAANGTTYYYVVTAGDASGNESTTSPEASATPEAPATTDPATVEFSLSASPFKVKGVHHADLAWNKDAAGTADVDVYRSGKKIATTANDGAHTDNIGQKGGGSYTYKVCASGSTTSCSSEVTIAF